MTTLRFSRHRAILQIVMGNATDRDWQRFSRTVGECFEEFRAVLFFQLEEIFQE